MALCNKTVRRNYNKQGVFIDILYKLTDEQWKVNVPDHMTEELVWVCDGSLAYARQYKCYRTLRENFRWNNMARKNILRACYKCETAKSPMMNTYVEVRNIITQQKCQMICIHFLGPLPKASRCTKNSVVCTDAFTRNVVLYAIDRPTTIAALKMVY